MKRVLALLLAIFLLLTGCQASGTGETTAPSIPEITAPNLPETTVSDIPETTDGAGEGTVAFANPGKVRLTYDSRPGYVLYITSRDQLPDHEALAGYDDAYFETGALILVVETVTSGSVQLDIDSITVENGTASVQLKREMKGDMGTADMATWMLWAEVERGLDYTWTLGGTTVVTGGERY